MKQTVGILLDHDMFKGVPHKRTGYEHIKLYNKAGNELGVQPFYMSLQHIQKNSALGYVFVGGRYQLTKRNIPKVTHNRALPSSSFLRTRLNQLAQSSIIFNRINRFGKHKIYKLLYTNRSLRTYLPHTIGYSRQNLKRALTMNNYSSLFIKPSSGSVGDGVIKLTKQENGIWNMHWKRGKPTRNPLGKTVNFLEKYIGKQRYIIQEAIPLATYKGRPYDLRVSVQRGTNGVWQITGMVGKVAAAGRHVTNVAKGGKVRRCEELFQASGFSPESMKQSISKASLDIAKFLGKKLPHLADIGLDIGVDQRGNIKLIEMNGRDQRITFKKAKLHTVFFQTYSTPLRYAKYLLNHTKYNR